MPPRRTDLLHHWVARKHISSAEYQSARRFQALYDAAALDGHAAIDTRRERIDGGRRSPAADRKVAAREELLRIRSRLGDIDWALLCRTLGRGEDLVGTGEEVRYLRRRVRDSLAGLSVRASFEMV